VKPSHHGSRTSSSEPFVRAVDPSVAVFSVQRDSRFGHPHPMVVERYKALGAHLLRTDKHGAITIRTDGQTVWVEPYTGEPAALYVPATHHLAETLTPPSAAPR
jgi:competence protein ComEC